jgi:hypothetical protein
LVAKVDGLSPPLFTAKKIKGPLFFRYFQALSRYDWRQLYLLSIREEPGAREKTFSCSIFK